MILLYIIFAIIAFILTIILRIKIPTIKGHAGESRVSFILNRLPNDKCIVVNDVMLNISHGTSQTDHVVFSV